MAGVQQYRNKQIIVRFDPEVCIHAAKCVTGLPAVFDVHKRPWVNVDGASPQAIQEQIAKCPSGALTCELVE